MAGPRGYSNYRGRTPLGKVLLIIVLILVILGAVGFMLLQQYVTYDENGVPHFLLPEKNPTEEVTPPTQPEPSIDLTIETPAQTQTALLAGDPAGWQAALADLAAKGQTAFAVDVKLPGGQVAFASRVEGVSLSATAVAATDALAPLLAGETHAIARLSCFRDGRYATGHLDSAGLENTGGYIFYDGNNTTWLDPGKAGARGYLCALAKECAALGFDEILLTDLSYPTVGKLDKIAYGETMKDQNFGIFLKEMKAALADYDVKLSIQLPAAAITTGRDSVAGLLLADLLPLVQGIYAPAATAEEASALGGAVAALSPETQFVPVIRGTPFGETYLLENG